MFSALTHLECPRCGATHDAGRWQGLCPACDSPLLARYDLDAVRLTPAELADRPADLWRYHELLPVSRPEAVVSLGETMTPLLAVPRLAAELGLERLWIKDEGVLPTGSFKARGAALGVARAVELGAGGLAMPTNGNAGAAWAAYAARAGLPMVVAMPVDAPLITRAEVQACGGRLVLVDGLISDAGRLVSAAVAAAVTDADAATGGRAAGATDRPWRDVGTLREPYRIEGKKTMGFELAEQLGWRMPDVVVYPTGGGVGLIGILKALRELLALGWIEGRLPRMVAVQSTACAPVVRAFRAGAARCEPWVAAASVPGTADSDGAAGARGGPRTVAYGITVPKPLGDELILADLAATAGTAIAVDDADLLPEIGTVGRLEGLFVCPEGAACVAAVRVLRADGWLAADDEVVVLNTGSGLIYPDAVTVEAPVLRPGHHLRL